MWCCLKGLFSLWVMVWLVLGMICISFSVFMGEVMVWLNLFLCWVIDIISFGGRFSGFVLSLVSGK